MAFDHTQAHRAAQMMDKSGGDFVGALAHTFFKADLHNARLIYQAFTHLFDQYYGMWVQQHQGSYETSVEFTEDLQGLAPALNGIFMLLDSARFRNWMRDTEQNYGADETHKVMLKYHALRSNMENMVHAAQDFEESMIELDVPK